MVGVDVTPSAVPRMQSASDAGVRPMDALLTRPMQIRDVGLLSGPPSDARYLQRQRDVTASDESVSCELV